MKKKTKQMIILLIVLAGCVAAYFAIVLITKAVDNKQEDEDAAAVIYVGDIDVPVELTINNGTQTLSFYQKDDVWYYSGDENFPLDTTLVETIAEAVPDLTASYKIQMAEDISSYGLDSPSYTLSATDANGKTVQINVGGTCGSSAHYATVDEDGSVYTISDDFITYLSAQLYSYLVPETATSLTEDSMSAITVSGDGKELRIERLTSGTGTDSETASDSTSDYTWYVANGGDYTSIEDYTTTAIADSGSSASAFVSSLVSLLSGYSFDSCVAYKPTADEISEFGLDDPQIKMTVEYITGTDDAGNNTIASYTLYLGAMFSTKDDSGNTVYYFYAALDPSYAVYVISADTLASLINFAQYCM